MKNFILTALALGIVVMGCRKASPTTFMKAFSIGGRGFGESFSSHSFTLSAVSPNFIPEVKFNGRQIPRENINTGFAEFYGEDTLPTVSSNTEVSLEAKFKDLNESDKKASSKITLPPEPTSTIKIEGNNVNVAWGKPDKKKVSFIYVFIYTWCSDGSVYIENSFDTVITDIENTTSVSRTIGTLCAPITSPIEVFAYGGVFNIYGPWSGSKDNIKGVKGQFYGGYGVLDTTSWFASPTNSISPKPNIPDKMDVIKRLINKIGGEVWDDGSWINGF